MKEYIPPIIIAVIFCIGAAVYWNSAVNVKSKSIHAAGRLNRYKYYFIRELSNPETEKIVKDAGLKITGLFYQIIRYSVMIPWVIYLLYSKFYMGGNVSVSTLIWASVFFATSPQKKVFGRASPFSMFLDGVQKRSRYRFNLEINRCLSQLKNIAIAHENKSYSSSFIIEELAKYTVHTKQVFNRLLGFWYESRYEEAANYFKDAIGTEEGEALVNLFLSLEGLKPSQLIKQIELYQNAAKEKRKTASQQMKESRSNILFLFVVGTGIIIFINFLVVVLGIDMIENFKSIRTR